MRAGFVVILALLALPAPALCQAPSQASGTTETDPNQRIRCRSTRVTGSLAQRERVCRTVAEWRRLEGDAQATARQMVDRGLVSSCGECRGTGN